MAHAAAAPDDRSFGLDGVVGRFEQLWLGGAAPSLDAFLDSLSAEERRLALPELAHVDLEFRLKAGQEARVEEYLGRFLELNVPPIVRALVATEYRHRRRRGEPPPGEYAARFPQLTLAPEDLPWAAPTVVGGASLADGGTADRSPEWPKVAGYEVQGELGRGGMGVVYRAHHLQLQRLVALKVIRADEPDEPQRARFLAEARAAAGLRHPHIVQVYEVGEHNGRPFAALELLEGGTLSAKVSQSPLPASEAAGVVETLARAVQHAHEQGIVHRDLKPANVLLTADGTPKVADFGLARRLGEAGQTQTGALVGTPSYMAPEQAGGKKDIGPAADAYGLGAILYECLTGRPPFRGDTPLETLRQVLDDDPVPPRRLQPKVPRDLDTICLKCLHKDPARRYARALDLAEDLRRLRAGEPVAARPVGPGERLLKWARRRPAAALLLLLIALGTLGSIAAVAGFAEYLRTALAQRTHELEDNQALLDEANAQSQRERDEEARKRQRQAFWTRAVLNLQRALDLRLQGEVTLSGNLVSQTWEVEDNRELHGTFSEEILTVQCSRVTWRLQPDDGPCTGVALSPDGTLLAVTADKGVFDRPWTGPPHVLPPGKWKTHIFFTPQGDELLRCEEKGEVAFWDVARGVRTRPVAVRPGTEAALGRDGRTLALARQTRWWAWDLVTNREFLQRDTGQRVTALALAPDSRTLAVALASGTIGLWDLASGREVGQLTGHMEPICNLVFSPDGGLLAAAEAASTARVWDWRQGAALLVFRAQVPLGNRSTLSFSPDGRLLAWGTEKRDPLLLNVAFPEVAASLCPDFSPAGPVAFSPDGRTLAVADRDGTFALLGRPTWKVERSFRRGHRGGLLALAWSADGAWLACGGADGVVEVWNASSGQRLLALPAHRTAARCLAFAPDGRTLATGGADALVRLYDLPAGRLRAILLEPTDEVHALAFSPDGRTLAGCGADRTLRVWDCATGKLRQAFPGVADRALAFHPDGRTLAASGPTPVLLDAATGQPLREFRGPSGPTSAVQLTPDGTALLGREGGNLYLWDAKSGALRFVLPVAQGDGGWSLAPDGRTLAVTGSDGSLTLLDVDTLHAHRPWGQMPHAVRALAFSWDGRRLTTVSQEGPAYLEDYTLPGKPSPQAAPPSRVLAGTGAGAIRVWDLGTGRQADQLAVPSEHAELTCLAVAPDGATIVAGGRGGTLWWWDRSRGQATASGPDLINEAARAAWGKVADAERLREPYRPEFDEQVQAVAFSPDGKYLATLSNKGLLQLWDSATHRLRHTLARNVESCGSVAFTPDSTTLMTSSKAEVWLWAVDSGQRVGGLKVYKGRPTDPLRDIALSPDGRSLAVAYTEGSIALWEFPSGRLLARSVGGHAGVVSALAFAPDGKTLASAGWDNRVKLWSPEGLHELLALPTHGKVHCLAFAPDGSTLASGGEGPGGTGDVVLWPTHRFRDKFPP
jgi:WD40 repeat protein